MGIFEPYRALGYITAGVPFSVQRRGTETFVTVSVGKAWQIYDVSMFLFCHMSCLVLSTIGGWKFVFLKFWPLARILLLSFFFSLLQCAKLTLVLVGEFSSSAARKTVFFCRYFSCIQLQLSVVFYSCVLKILVKLYLVAAIFTASNVVARMEEADCF